MINMDADKTPLQQNPTPTKTHRDKNPLQTEMTPSAVIYVASCRTISFVSLYFARAHRSQISLWPWLCLHSLNLQYLWRPRCGNWIKQYPWYVFYRHGQIETIRQTIDEDSYSVSLSDKYMNSRAAPNGSYARNKSQLLLPRSSPSRHSSNPTPASTRSSADADNRLDAFSGQ